MSSSPPPSRSRTASANALGRGSSSKTPTTAPEEIPNRIAALIETWRASPYHPIEAAADFHLRFEAIHPFVDGNGRTGRLLLNLMLVQADFEPVNVKYADRHRYYDALEAFDASGSITAMTELVARYELDALRERLSLKG